MGWIFAGIVAALVLFILLGFSRSGWKLRPRQILSVIGLLVICGGMVATVPTGHTGILTTFGKVEDVTLEAGDKIFLWENLKTLRPLCNAYTVNQ